MSGNYYHGYNTIFKNVDDNTVLLSDDGSVYVENDTISNEVVEPELTEEEIANIEKQNKIFELQLEIQALKCELTQSDYVIIKCQEYLLAGKELPSEYDITSYNEQRDTIRSQINELEAELMVLSE